MFHDGRPEFLNNLSSYMKQFVRQNYHKYQTNTTDTHDLHKYY